MQYTGNLLHLSVLVTVLMTGFLVESGVNAQASTPYRLVGVVHGKDFTGAVLDDGKSGQILYQKGEQLPDGSRIAKVQKESITITQSDGTSYDLFLPQNAPSSALTRSSTGSAAGSTSASPQQMQPPAQMNTAPPGSSTGRQEQGTGTLKKRGKNGSPRFRSPRTSQEN